MVIIGIAASLSEDLRVGDVAIATQVDLYLEAGKASGNEMEFSIAPGGSAYQAPRELVDLIGNWEFADVSAFSSWQEQCRRRLSEIEGLEREAFVTEGLLREVPGLHECQVASGPLVGASNAFSDWLRRRERQYKVLEMESGGAMASAYERTEPKRTMVLRGISDYGDERKTQLDKVGGGVLRRLGMQNATAFLFSLLTSGALSNIVR